MTQRPVAESELAPLTGASNDPQLVAALKLVGANRYVAVGTRDTVLLAKDLERGMRTGQAVIGLVTTQGHYLLVAESEKLGAASPPPEGALPGTDAAPADRKLLGWSNAADSRSIRTGASVPIQQGLIQTAGGACSGAAIGRRLVRTAAHCVIQSSAAGGSPIGTVNYFQAVSGNVARAIDATSSFFYGGQYISKGCGTTVGMDPWAGFRANRDSCILDDWAILILSTDWYSEAGGTSWYGFIAPLASGNLNNVLISGGYPICDDFLNANGTNNDNMLLEDPANCRTNPNAYWQTMNTVDSNCKIGAWIASDFSTFRSGCDVSPGNSGGPALNGSGNVVANWSWQDCSTCTSTTNFPNRFFATNTWMFNFQVQLRNDYP